MRYRYGSAALAGAPLRRAETLYVVGGLYGNLPALDAVLELAQAEAGSPTLCFNGDFNWFDVDDECFAEVNRRVLEHDAILGNVEAEFDAALSDDAGCGCAYPDSVDAGLVERSNLIHRQLKATAARHPALTARIARLAMFARYEVAGSRVGVVHGDAESLAGWRFDVGALHDPAQRGWLDSAFESAQVDIFASSHTCLPALRAFDRPHGARCVVNNGAAGMPNFHLDRTGLCTRIGAAPSPHPVLHERRIGDAFVALLRVRYDVQRWHAMFLRQWPGGSPAWVSYWPRVEAGPAFTPAEALGLAPA